jgi:hypothetical protein
MWVIQSIFYRSDWSRVTPSHVGLNKYVVGLVTVALESSVAVTSRRPYPFASFPPSLTVHLTAFPSPDPHHAPRAPRCPSSLSLALLLLDSLLPGFSFFFTSHCRQVHIPSPLSPVNQGKVGVTTSPHEEGFFFLLQSILVGARRATVASTEATEVDSSSPCPHCLHPLLLLVCLLSL